MLYSMNAMTKVKLKSSDAFHGDIRDIYFEDISWIVRYLVVDVGTWAEGKYVLISPEAIDSYNKEEDAFHTKLSKKQMHDSPSYDTTQTVSRQYEENLHRYYGWSPYWIAFGAPYPYPGIYTYPQDPMPSTPSKEINVRRDPERENLRSFQEIKQYGLRATDGDLGELDDLLIDPVNWRITHVIADAKLWWPGGQVIIDRGLVTDIDWIAQKIAVAMTKEEVKQAPPYDGERGITESYQIHLSRYYQAFKDRVPSSGMHSVQVQSSPGSHV